MGRPPLFYQERIIKADGVAAICFIHDRRHDPMVANRQTHVANYLDAILDLIAFKLNAALPSEVLPTEATAGMTAYEYTPDSRDSTVISVLCTHRSVYTALVRELQAAISLADVLIGVHTILDADESDVTTAARRLVRAVDGELDRLRRTRVQ